jgi:pimeloyl-ACP methyl ester carboxylesterase
MLTFFKDYARLPALQINAFRADPSWPGRVQLAPSVCREVKAVSTYTSDPSRFTHISKPTLFLLGRESPQAVATSVHSGAAALPQSQLHILPGQQHDAMYTAPEMLAHEIANFFFGVALRQDGLFETYLLQQQAR